MSQEYAMLRGRLAVCEETASAISCGIDCDISELRLLADPFEEKTELQTEKMTALVARIGKDVKRIADMKKTIAVLQKDLGM